MVVHPAGHPHGPQPHGGVQQLRPHIGKSVLPPVQCHRAAGAAQHHQPKSYQREHQHQKRQVHGRQRPQQPFAGSSSVQSRSPPFLLLYADAGAVSHTHRPRVHKLPAKGVLPCAAQNPQTPCAPCRSGRSVCGHGSLRWDCAPSALQGSSGGCSGCNYAPAAGTPSVRWGSSCGTPLCPPTGAKYTAPMARCWPPTAAAGPCAPAPGRCRRISLPLPPRGLRRF